MSEKENVIELPDIPKNKDYEDYLCAYLQAGGLYVERSIIHREVAELLELDLLTTNFQENSANNLLIEIKSGDWGFNEIFKIRGWLTYLNFTDGCFIVQKTIHSSYETMTPQTVFDFPPNLWAPLVLQKNA